jgi:hypothetical protein
VAVVKRTILIAVVCASIATPAMADMYGFYCITDKASAVDAAAASQLSVNITQVAADPTKVAFTFKNDVGTPCSITDIYFYDGVLVNFKSVSIDQSDGVYYPADGEASPGHLPDYDPKLGVLYSTDSTKPATGVNVLGEWITLTYTLQNGVSFDGVLDGLEDGTIVIGVHVTAFADGGSASFLATPSVVPIPGAVLLGMLGLGTAGLRLRRTA